MENQQALNHRLDAIGWGAFFIWWGLTELIPSMPKGMGAVGVGLILLGLNAARSLNGIPSSLLTTTLGVLAVVLGGLELARPVLHLAFELPVFSICLIVIGAVFLVREFGHVGTR